MASDDGGGLQDFVAGRYAELRRSAFLMCGDWALADELTQKSLARLVAQDRRTAVGDPDAFVYSHLMASFQHRRSRSRQHLFVADPRVTPEAAADAPPPAAPGVVSDAEQVSVAAPRHRSTDARREADVGLDAGPDGTSEVSQGGTPGIGAGDPIRTILVLDALHKLAPRCRAVIVLRHWDGFAVDEAADMLGLADERVDAYEAAGLAALDYLLAEKEPAR